MEINRDVVQTQVMCDMNHRVSQIISDNFLTGKRVYILCGGPSLKEFDFTLLEKETTIGMNMSYERWLTTFCVFWDRDLYMDITVGTLDKKFNENLRERFINFKGIKVFLAQPARIVYEYGCYVVNRLFKETISYSVKEGVYAGTNCTLFAIMFAIALGCKDIYLLGADMKVAEATHYHGRYNHPLSEFAERCRMFKQEIELWSERWSREHIKITQVFLNNPEESALTCFSKIKFSNLSI